MPYHASSLGEHMQYHDVHSIRTYPASNTIPYQLNFAEAQNHSIPRQSRLWDLPAVPLMNSTYEGLPRPTAAPSQPQGSNLPAVPLMNSAYEDLPKSAPAPSQPQALNLPAIQRTKSAHETLPKHATSPPQPQVSNLPSIPLPIPTVSACETPKKAETGNNDAFQWDGWPDGCFDRDVDWAEFMQTKSLQVHWSYRAVDHVKT